MQKLVKAQLENNKLGFFINPNANKPIYTTEIQKICNFNNLLCTLFLSISC